MLTTLLVHAAGEWVSSFWPVCPASETSAHVKGAALTYARRYRHLPWWSCRRGRPAWTLPDIPRKEQSPERAPPKRGGNGSVHAPPTQDVTGSAGLRDRLLREIAETVGEEALAVWAKRAMPAKNQLTEGDARAVEAAYLSKVNGGSAQDPIAPPGPEALGEHQTTATPSTQAAGKAGSKTQQGASGLCGLAAMPSLPKWGLRRASSQDGATPFAGPQGQR